MCVAFGQVCRTSITWLNVRFSRFSVELAQHRVYKRCSRPLARPLYQFNALIDGSPRRDTLQVSELIYPKTKGSQDLAIELLQLLGRLADYLRIQAGSPAKHSHHQFCA